MDSIIQKVLDGDWVEITNYTERQAALKIAEKIEEKKKEIIARLNAGYSE